MTSPTGNGSVIMGAVFGCVAFLVCLCLLIHKCRVANRTPTLQIVSVNHPNADSLVVLQPYLPMQQPRTHHVQVVEGISTLSGCNASPPQGTGVYPTTDGVDAEVELGYPHPVEDPQPPQHPLPPPDPTTSTHYENPASESLAPVRCSTSEPLTQNASAAVFDPDK